MNRTVAFHYIAGRTLAYLVIFGGVLLILIPFLWMILSSFKTSSQVYQIPLQFIPNPLSLEGYARTFEVWNIPRYFFNTTLVSLSVTLGSVLICSLAGYAFAKLRFPGKNLLFYYILASLMLPFQVRMITTFLLLKRLGMLNTYVGLILPWLATGFAVFLMRQITTAVPNSLIDAARIDGCSEPSIFLKVIVPNVKPGIFALSIITFMTTWNDMLWPFVIVSKEKLKTLPLLIASIAGGHMEITSMPWPTRMAAVTIVLIPVLILYSLTQRYIIRAMAITSGIK